MIYFLLTYDRATQAAKVDSYDDTRVALSEYARRELELLDERQYEVVLLCAESEAEIRQTHSRYFSDDLTLA